MDQQSSKGRNQHSSKGRKQKNLYAFIDASELRRYVANVTMLAISETRRDWQHQKETQRNKRQPNRFLVRIIHQAGDFSYFELLKLLRISERKQKNQANHITRYIFQEHK